MSGKKSTATTDFLGSIHEAVAKEFMKQLDEGTKVLTRDGEIMSVSPSPALLTAICKFLKDNGIEAAEDTDSAASRLADKMDKLLNQDPDEDQPYH